MSRDRYDHRSRRRPPSPVEAAHPSRLPPGRNTWLARDPRPRRGNAADTTPDLPDLARVAASPGSPLPGELRRRFERSLGTDLTGVRLHRGPASAAAADAIGAQAYTVGRDIHFGKGRYNPSGTSGQLLIAHEVAHTVQQQGASPAAMAKLEVSDRGDAAEVEADRAAGAMVGGRSYRVTRGIGAGVISRQAVGEEIVAKDKHLPDAIEADIQPWAQAYDQTAAWGSRQTTTTDAHGNPVERDSAIMRNAGRNERETGRQDLVGLSQETDAVRPLIRQWVLAQQTVLSIARRSDIDPYSPGKYAADVRRALGSSTMQNPRSEIGQQMQQNLQGASSQSMQATTGRVRACLAKLQGVKNRLEAYRTRLVIAKRQREVREAKGELERINQTIGTVSMVLTSVANVTSAVAGVLAATSAAGKLSHSGTRGASSGNMIDGILRATVFARRIRAINERIVGLNSQIDSLTAVSERLDVAALTNDLRQAKAEYEEASHSAGNAGQSFFNGMRMAGRAYDRRDWTEQQSANVAGPTPGTGQSVSMEALLSFVAALQGRRAAREAFGSFLASATYLDRAEQISTTALVGGRPAEIPVEGPGGRRRVLAVPPIDHSDRSQHFSPSPALRLEGAQLRNTVGVVRGNIAAYHRSGPTQQQQEEAWMALVQRASGGLIH